MTFVETRMSVWEALAGRAPGEPLGPADPGLWGAVVERLNPARARPVLRAGIEAVELTSVRGFRVRDAPLARRRRPRLLPAADPGGVAARPADGRHAARWPGWSPSSPASPAGSRPTRSAGSSPTWPATGCSTSCRSTRSARCSEVAPPAAGRSGSAAALLAFARGRRMRARRHRPAGRACSTAPAAGCCSPGPSRSLLGAGRAWPGSALFGWHLVARRASRSSSPAARTSLGAAVLLGLNVVALACHELGHALATKHAGRRVPAAGFLVYFGIPSVFVDTTDVWMAGRRARMLTTAAGPAAGLVLAGVGAARRAGRARRSRRGASSSPSPGTSTRCSTSTRSSRSTATTC